MSFTIRYEGINLDDGMDIKDFGESLIGFGELSKEIFKVGKIKGEIDVKITSVRKGSIIVDIAFGITDIINLFGNFEDLLYFIEITDLDLYNKITSNISSFGSDTIERWKDLEEFAKDFPILVTLIGFPLFIKILNIIINFNIKDKNTDNFSNQEYYDIGNGTLIKGSVIKNVKKIVNKGKSSHFLEPIIEDKVSNIKIGKENNYIEINNSNFENFIGKGNEILSGLENGKTYELIGSFTAMQSNKGETISFVSHQYKNNNNQPFHFSCYLLDGKTTEDYAEFYGSSKDLKVFVEVIRVSNYKKPKLKIIKVELHQTILDV